MSNLPDPIFLGSREEQDSDEVTANPDHGAIREAVDTAARQENYDGYQILSEGTVFIQSIWGKDENLEYVCPVAAGVRLNYDYVREQELVAPEAFLILKTETLIDPSMVRPEDIIPCSVEDNQLGKWLWSYWVVKETLDHIVLDESYPEAEQK
jgi:hypothetical protein